MINHLFFTLALHLKQPMLYRMQLRILGLSVLMLSALPGQAAIDTFEFTDETMRNRFYHLTEQLRCPTPMPRSRLICVPRFTGCCARVSRTDK